MNWAFKKVRDMANDLMYMTQGEESVLCGERGESVVLMGWNVCTVSMSALYFC